MVRKSDQTELLRDYAADLEKQLAFCRKCQRTAKELIAAGSQQAPQYVNLLAELFSIEADLIGIGKMRAACLSMQPDDKE